MMGGYGGYGFGAGMGFGGIGMILIWIVLIVAAVVLVRWLVSGSRSRTDADRGGTALDILRERYARGEIDKNEFDRKRRDLGAQ
jgi:putative membrane protein